MKLNIAKYLRSPIMRSTIPVEIIRTKAANFAIVKKFCINDTNLTLKQLTNASSAAININLYLYCSLLSFQ